MSSRTYAFIDGFNLYHALMGPRGAVGPLSKYRWLNLKGVVSDFLEKDDTLAAVYYFTAYAYWNSPKVGRHKTYVRALESQGVNIVLGKFYEVEKFCTQCQGTYITNEEKQSDVNLATQIVQHAYKNSFDKAVIITGDSDICPAIQTVKAAFAGKHLKVLVPPARKAKELGQIADSHHSISEDCLKRNQFPGIMTDGRGPFYVPSGWA